MKFEIKNRWSGEAIFSCELTAELAGAEYSLQLGFAVKKAVASSADLSRADLSGANLSGAYLSRADLSSANLYGANLYSANLSGANLSGANLSRADLSRAYLSRADLSRAYLSRADLSRADLSSANLSRADLSGAYLSSANLSGANLSSANLSSANLSGADLSSADLSGANLSRADLSRANLYGANLRSVRADFYDVLAWAPTEVPALIDAIKNGRVDGSTYQGACACLVGTIANVRGVSYDTLEHDSGRPIEVFFGSIRKGDTPDTNQFSAIATEWAEAWLANMQAAFAPSKRS
jgi:uncharacterized protein YjbI with pentapeptide repeats